MNKVREYLGKIIDRLSAVGMAVTLVLMFVTAIDTILRKTSGLALSGSLEITEMGMVILIFFGIASNQVTKGHVCVDMFMDMFPQKVRNVSDAIILFIEAGVIGLMSYSGYLLSISYLDKGLVTDVLGIPVWPFAVLMTIGLLLFAVLLFIDATLSALMASKGERSETA